MICQRDSNDQKEKYKTDKNKSQGQSAITKNWFDLDHEWLRGNFVTYEPDFY